MSQTAALWILGGWFVLSTVGSMMIARIMAQESSAEVSDLVETPARSKRQADRAERPRMAA
jgi:hypothetical protein